jgi:hypothetical protein
VKRPLLEHIPLRFHILESGTHEYTNHPGMTRHTSSIS